MFSAQDPPHRHHHHQHQHANHRHVKKASDEEQRLCKLHSSSSSTRQQQAQSDASKRTKGVVDSIPARRVKSGRTRASDFPGSVNSQRENLGKWGTSLQERYFKFHPYVSVFQFGDCDGCLCCVDRTTHCFSIPLTSVIGTAWDNYAAAQL